MGNIGRSTTDRHSVKTLFTSAFWKGFAEGIHRLRQQFMHAPWKLTRNQSNSWLQCKGMDPRTAKALTLRLHIVAQDKDRWPSPIVLGMKCSYAPETMPYASSTRACQRSNELRLLRASHGPQFGTTPPTAMAGVSALGNLPVVNGFSPTLQVDICDVTIDHLRQAIFLRLLVFLEIAFLNGILRHFWRHHEDFCSLACKVW